MLERLHIKNIAVIDEAEIDFKNGFNALTGETGAGKSIIIDSINMVLGERTSKTLIRNGEKKAVVEAVFYVDSPYIINKLDTLGVEIEDNMLVIYRDINTDGKSICKINGFMTNATGVREIASMLINIHGQQDNQSLLTPSSHISFLNSYCGLTTELTAYQEQHKLVTELEEKINSLDIDEKEKERQADLYKFQIEEIESAKLIIGEDDTLSDRKRFINSIGKIADTVNNSHSVLYGSEKSVYDYLSRCSNDYSGICEYDTKLKEIYERLNSITIELDDIIYQIRDYRESIEYDESEIDFIENRLYIINNLKRKYGNTIEDIIKYKEEISQKLDLIVKSDEEKIRLKKELDIAKKVRGELATALTRTRKKCAAELSEKICLELSDLDMSKVKFDVMIKECDYNKNGCDDVEFLISVNAGEPLKPLSKIASGGEMSRIMLAIKSIFADSDYVDTLIFDEIDTGVSGRAAQKIAEKINKISRSKQIICITHLAQIAAMADTHFLINKKSENDKTYTSVIELDCDARKSELARIIGGAEITQTTLSAASEMINMAEKIKKS